MRLIIAVVVALAAVVFAAPAEVLAAPEGQVVIAQGGDPSTLDPHMHAENFTFAVVHNVFDHLVRRFVKQGQLAHEPGLATSWTNVNPTTWEGSPGGCRMEASAQRSSGGSRTTPRRPEGQAW
jgi:ABC-type transport system substrate-binding protein